MTTTARFTANNTNNDEDPDAPPQTQEEIAEDAKVRAEKLKIAVVCIISYFVIGCIAFCFVFESWTFSDAMYMLMVTLVTVGYGDRNGAPTTQGGRLFHTFFVLYGISIVAVALVEIANSFLEKREAMLKEAQVNETKAQPPSRGFLILQLCCTLKKAAASIVIICAALHTCLYFSF